MNWYPSSDPKQPYYPRTIKVHDLTSDLPDPMLAYWKACLTKALAQWKPGMAFRVSTPESGYKTGFVTLDVTQTQDGTVGQAYFGFLPPEADIPAPGVGWAHIDPEFFEQSFQSGVRKGLVHVLAHEVGHCLGFGHGGDGAMSPTSHTSVVNAEEINALRAYWKT